MPSAFGAIDTGMPDLSGAGSTEDKLRAIQDYLYQLLEQLRYTLNNLSQDNFNEAEVGGWLGETITKPIHAEIESVEEGLSTQIDVTAGAIALEARKTYAPLWSAGTYYKGNTVRTETTSGGVTTTTYYQCNAASTTEPPPHADWTVIQIPPEANSRFQVTADAITSEVSRATEAEDTLSSRITQTADAITAEVTRATGAEETLSSTIAQTADGIRTDVSKVTPITASEWARSSSTGYAAGTIVKVSTTDNGVTTTAYYLCYRTHSKATSDTEPGVGAYWKRYWEPYPAQNAMQSQITQTADAITAEVTRATGAEGSLSTRITANAEGLTSKVSKDSVISTINQSAEAVSINASKVNLTGYITATDLGSTGTTVIDGGRITTGSISADRISGGTLDAGNITVKDSFEVKTTTPNNTVIDCGSLGGSYTEREGNVYEGNIHIESLNHNDKSSYLMIDNEEILMSTSYRPEGHYNYADAGVRVLPFPFNYSVYEVSSVQWDTEEEESRAIEIRVYPGGIDITKRNYDGSSKTYDLLSLLDQI